MAIGKLKTVVLDAPDIARLSAFYSELAGWTQRYADHEWITMTTGDGWRIGLQSAPDHVPPQWPDASHPQQAHLDLRVPDLAAGTQKAVELGAKLLQENERWNTLADPAGHPFDLCLAQDNETTTLMGVMLDCPDAKVLSAFYSDLLGKPVTYEGDGVAMIGEDGGQPVMFQQIENYQAPRWPAPAYPQQFHLDVTVDEIEAAEQEAREADSEPALPDDSAAPREKALAARRADKEKAKRQRKAEGVKEIHLRPRKTDIRITHFGLAWVPFRGAAEGDLRPFYAHQAIAADSWRSARAPQKVEGAG